MFGARFLRVVGLSFLLAVLSYSALLAETGSDEINLQKIVVTPYGYSEVLSKTPSSVSVITPADIRNSNAEETVDMFRSIPGLTVRDLYGNGTKVAVDIHGFGEQAALNVLVLVDGRRVNDVDLSGVDWKQIPLDQVERIEIIRGGAAAVLYGDNASSGVINIITKKGEGKPKVNLKVEYGSYDKNAQKLSLGGSIDNKFSYLFNLGRDATNGYRNNTFDKNNDFASNLEYKFNDIFSTHFNSGFHAATFGLPGALFQNDIDEHGRSYARYANDHVNNKDYYFVTGVDSKPIGWGDFNVDFSYRIKDTDSYFLSSGLYTERNKIETFGVTPKYTLGHDIFDRENKLLAGFDYYRSFYNSDQFNQANDSDIINFTNICKTSLAGYLQDEFSIFKQLVLTGGYRYEIARYGFSYHDNYWGSPDQDTKLYAKMNAFNTGLIYNYNGDSSVFFNAGKSFRFPEVDEFTYLDSSWHTQLNTELQPQSAINYQLGLRQKFSERFKASISLFRMNVKDELYFNGDPLGNNRNGNYDKTVHQGFEFSLDAKLNTDINLYGNYTFTNAYFDGGQYDNNAIPMVPQHKGSVGLRWALPGNFMLNLTGTYVGQRYFLNDQANAYSRLNGYMIADTNLSWRHKDLTVTFGINNLFDKQYSEFAGILSSFSSGHTIGDKFYYPNPGRNFSLKIDYTF
ncbi:MAG: TonB-dependent receptor [Candidatus Omnitrophota bacterium]|jgi:iron complex outermembrane receptor protein